VTSTIRAFIAIELPQTVKQELAQVSAGLAQQVAERAVRWVQPEKMHLTLRFLGDTAVPQLPILTHQLDDLATQHKPFNLHLGGLGCFPNRQRPRVIWAGLVGDEAALQSLKRELDERLSPLGWLPDDKAFQAHLTLGRVNDGRQLTQIKWDTAVKPIAFTVKEVHLIASRLTPKGPHYTVQHTAVLQK
jgi:2'-5' RNA ligase